MSAYPKSAERNAAVLAAGMNRARASALLAAAAALEKAERLAPLVEASEHLAMSTTGANNEQGG